ncbi:MAG: hypothetical protein QXX20_01580 [Candidatus Thermoplasmatota archaeon]
MKKICLYFFMLIVGTFSVSVVLGATVQNTIYVDYFYNPNCGSCQAPLQIIKAIEPFYSKYTSVVVFQYKDVREEPVKSEYESLKKEYGVGYPFALVYNATNKTLLPKSDIMLEGKLNETIQQYLAGIPVQQFDRENLTFDVLFWTVTINVKEYSFPVLTIIFGVVDSFNPCAFFVLIFLMNLLIHMQSRKRMLLIGGIFVFFSGLIYFIFMSIILNAFVFAERMLILANTDILILTIAVGFVATVLGLLNIKDFFFFKKGISLSIPESKKPGIFKQMRRLIHEKSLVAVIGGAIFLAISVNLYELICSAIVPTAYVNILTKYNLSMLESYQYLFAYNVVYVIPFIIIVLIFVYTLGRRQLSEWQGRVLKLFSGIMIFSFGLLFLINYQLLENMFTPAILLFVSLASTWAISNYWKKYKEQAKPEPDNDKKPAEEEK